QPQTGDAGPQADDDRPVGEAPDQAKEAAAALPAAAGGRFGSCARGRLRLPARRLNAVAFADRQGAGTAVSMALETGLYALPAGSACHATANHLPRKIG